MRKLIFEGMRGVIYISLIVFICNARYDQGKKDAGDKYFTQYYRFYTPQMWIETPPTIAYECWTSCKSIERVTWDEYVSRYHASRMRLDNPTYKEE